MQVISGGLQYPTLDFTQYAPSTNNDNDYSGLTGDRVAYYEFRSSVARSNMRLVFDGISWSDIASGDVKIEIKICADSGTRYWGDISKNFDLSEHPPTTDGWGMKTSQSGNYVNLSFGPSQSTADNINKAIVLRITMKDSFSGSLSSLQIKQTDGSSGW